ncbi:DNA-3-methyladenine glycosylase family protein [Salsuginibacillus kocurii]|uniref:DNA-3-methyladenine glycosylase family protein n=1 Tax=Salsuginibacillus kocurii TaxID=427078 RepID=UPI0003794E8E|nr:DNA-3-methyladenine glycosylase [Salsuginibacillus kocurii]
MWRETVCSKSTYHIDYLLKRLAMDPVHSVDIANRKVHVPMQIDGRKAPVTLSLHENKHHTEITIESDLTNKDKTISELRRIFLWDRSLEEITDHFTGTELEKLFDRYYGTPLVCDFDLYGSLMRTIIHQQLNMAFAYTLSSRFCKLFGEEINQVWFYPSPERIAACNVEELKALQFSQRKAEYVIDVSRAIAAGELNLEMLREASDEEVFRTLTSYRGLGPWTAECFLLFGLGRMNVLPVKDIGIQNGLKKWLELERKPSPAELYNKAAQWSPYNSYASLYIWLYTEND